MASYVFIFLSEIFANEGSLKAIETIDASCVIKVKFKGTFKLSKIEIQLYIISIIYF